MIAKLATSVDMGITSKPKTLRKMPEFAQSVSSANIRTTELKDTRYAPVILTIVEDAYKDLSKWYIVVITV